MMNAQDAREIAGIVTEHARALWDVSGKPSEPKASVEGAERSYRLKSESGTLALVANDTKPFIALSYEGTVPCKLTVTQGVTLVQVIDHLVQLISGADS